jgi:pantothenate kinase
MEGNYLLLGHALGAAPPALGPSVMIAPPEAVLEARLVRRWIDHGLREADAAARARGNDMPNARTVLSLSGAADEFLDFAA